MSWSSEMRKITLVKSCECCNLPWLEPRTEIPSQFIDGHRSPMRPIDGHQWSIDGHRWGFSNDDPIDGSSMDHRWPIDGNRNFRSQKFVRLGHVQNFNKTFKFFSQFKLFSGFRGWPSILFGNEVVHSHSYYLSLWKTGFCGFSKEKTPNFLIQKRNLRVKFLHISDLFSSYKQMVFSVMEARFRHIFMRIIAISPGVSDFPEKNLQIFGYKYVF